MKTAAVLISIAIIICGQFAKYRYKLPKEKKSFFRSQFFWTALYEIAIIFLGAILAIQLTEISEIKIAKKHTISALENITEVVNHSTLNYPLKIDDRTDDDYDEKLRNLIYNNTIDKCNIIENILSQSDIQTNLSSRSYIRFMLVLANNKNLANEMLTTTEPSFIYKQIEEQNNNLIECIQLEIEHLQGKRSEKHLGDWIAKSIRFSSQESFH